jgi:hypothetical protein
LDSGYGKNFCFRHVEITLASTFLVEFEYTAAAFDQSKTDSFIAPTANVTSWDRVLRHNVLLVQLVKKFASFSAIVERSQCVATVLIRIGRSQHTALHQSYISRMKSSYTQLPLYQLKADPPTT